MTAEQFDRIEAKLRRLYGRMQPNEHYVVSINDNLWTAFDVEKWIWHIHDKQYKKTIGC